MKRQKRGKNNFSKFSFFTIYSPKVPKSIQIVLEIFYCSFIPGSIFNTITFCNQKYKSMKL